MKFFRTLITLICLIACSGLSEAVTIVHDNIYYEVLSVYDKTVKVVSSPNKYKGDVFIPDTVKYNGQNIIVKEIGAKAFYQCSELTSVRIPDYITVIPDSCFYECSSLTSLSLPREVKKIGKYAYYKCSSLTSISIPATVTEIGNYAFYNAVYVNEITFESAQFDNYLRSLTIGSYAFYGLPKIKKVVIPPFITSVGEKAFEACGVGDLWELLDFRASNRPLNIKMPVYTKKKLELIRPLTGVFCYNKYIEEITFGESVTELPAYLFSGCTAIKTLIIPNTIIKIGKGCFAGFTSLKRLIFEDGSYLSLESNWVNPGNMPDGLISPGTNLEYLYIGRNLNYSITIRILKGSGQMICDYCPFPEISVDSLELGSKMTFIPDQLFMNSSLKSITIPANITSIGIYAFERSHNLETIWGTGGGKFKESSFAYCTGLKKLNIPSGATQLLKYSFQNCTNLEEVTIPESVESIDDAFYACNSIRKIYCRASTPPQNISTTKPARCFSEDVYAAATLYVPKGSKELYLNSDLWGNFWNIVEMDFSGVEDAVIDTNDTESEASPYYDMQGRRISNPGPGVYIHGKKKIIIP